LCGFAWCPHLGEIQGPKTLQAQNSAAGWWLTYPSEKYDFVSWDDDIPNIWKVIKAMFQTTNQCWVCKSLMD